MNVLSPPPRLAFADIVHRALLEDLGRGDVTTESTVPPDLRGAAVLVAREELVVSGLEVFAETFAQVDPSLTIEMRTKDGSAIGKGTVAARVSGASASILKGERVALNFIQRMSGIATKTRGFVAAVPSGSTLRVTDTRKTTPGLRVLERYAARCGGGYNHRDDLSSAVLIKDNHIAAAGGVRVAIERARAHAPHTSKIECEVDRMEQLEEALAAGADIVMLDNFDDGMLAEAVTRTKGRALLEVSGGVTLDRLPRIAITGINVVSVGGLTHSARAVDFGLDWS